MGTPQPPAYVSGPVLTLPQHSIYIGDWRDTVTTELQNITNRRITVSVNQPNVLSFSVNGDDEEALLLEEGISDVWWVREGVTINRHRLVSVTDAFEATPYTVNCECVDYRGLLSEREIITATTEADHSRVYAATQNNGAGWFQEDIVWDLINTMQAQVGGNLGITKGIFPATGVKKEITFRDADTIASCIDTIAQADPGFEYNIDFNRKLNLYYPYRGAGRGVKLEYGGLISQVNRTLDMRTDYANWTRTQSGDAALKQNIKAVPDLGNRPEGRWDMTFTDNDLSTQDAVDKTAARNFTMHSAMLPTLDLTFAPGAWLGPNHVWAGDTVEVYINRGRLNIAITTRVTDLTIALDDNGMETVTATVGIPPNDPYGYVVRTLKKLTRSA